MDIFGTPPQYLEGLLGSQEVERLRKQSIGTGLLSALVGGLQAAPMYRTQGIAPILGQALQSGMQGAQNVYGTALENFMTQQKIGEMQRQQEQRKAQEEAIAQLPQDQQTAYRAFGSAAVPALVERNLPKPVQPELREVDGALYQISPGQKPMLLVNKKGRLTGEFANIALTKYKTDIADELPQGAFEEIVGDVERLAAARKPSTTVNVGAPQFESQYGKQLGGDIAKEDLALYNAAQKIPQNINKIDTTLKQLQSSEARTGFAADLLKNIDRVRAKVLADEKAGKRVADTEVLNALLGSEVFPQIGALGIGARGLDTPAEREFLREVIAGTITMDKNALIRLAQIRRNIEERSAQTYNEALQTGQLDEFFKYSKRQRNPIEIPQVAQPAAGGMQTIRTQEEYNKLPSGSIYLDPNGVRRRKQ